MDVVTGGELAVAMAADFPAGRLNFHGNNKGREELAEAVRYGIASITLDSFHEIELLNDVASEQGVRQKVMLRLSPSVDPHTHMLTSTGILDSTGAPDDVGEIGEPRVALYQRAPDCHDVHDREETGS